MAKILARNLATYPKEHDSFLRDLQHFHEIRGTAFKRYPIIGGKEVDLYLLYTLVTSQGGWIKVNSKNGWSELLEHLKIPKNCVNGSVALKQIYLRYLDRWEKVHFLGEEADRGSDDDEESRHKRWSARALHSVPLTYNYSQHNIAEANREYNHLSADLYKPSEYDKLALSLISPLPNEQDYAINVCTLLSNEGKHTLKLEKHPRIIDYLLGHAGVFCHSSLRKLFVNCYNNVRKHPIHGFWKDVLESEEFLDLTNENLFINNNNNVKNSTVGDDEESGNNCKKRVSSDGIGGVASTSSSSSSSVVPMELGDNNTTTTTTTSEVITTVEFNKTFSDCKIINCDSFEEKSNINNNSNSLKNNKTIKVKLNYDKSDKELFCLGHTIGTQDYIGQRILQIITILRNLSFIDENVPILVKNKTFIRFLLLCASSEWNQLKNFGLDMLGNLATELQIKDISVRLSKTLLKIITKCLQSQDRSQCISSLEVLNKLSQNELNEDTLIRYLQNDVYKKVCSFLTIHDVSLLIYTLECLYSLSSLGERSCNLIINNHGVIDTLVSLVTVEGKSYGPKACIGMKLVETLPGGICTTTAANSNISSNTTTISSPSSSSLSSSQSTNTTTSTTTTNLLSTTMSAITSTPIITSTLTTKLVSASTPVRTVQLSPQRLLTISPSTVATSVTVSTTQTTTQSMTPQQLIQQQHAHQQAIHENEQFALAWLRATYEPHANGKVDHQELYKHYINSCSKIGRRGVISPLHFPRCVRSVFGGTVGPNPMKSTNTSESQYYEGIKVRVQPLIINIQTTTTTQSNTTQNQSPVITTLPNKGNNRRKIQTTSTTTTTNVQTSTQSPTLNVIPDNINDNPPISPASPILKAQLSAPPKQRDATSTASSKGDIKSQVMAHPHLSQALLGTGSSSSPAAGSSKDNQLGQSNTSLIKSLLATKVNDCMTTVSMRTATDCQNVAQVAARQQQQRLLAQQINTPTTTTTTTTELKTTAIKNETPKSSRVNGIRQLFNDSDIGDPSVSSTTQFASSVIKGKKEPPQPPPPPLAPLSNLNRLKSTNTTSVITNTSSNTTITTRIENEDSDSTGNNSLASSSGMGTIGIGGISSTEDGDNSLTSFEGLLNGLPNIDNPLLNDDSNSKDSIKLTTTNTTTTTSNEICKNKPLRLADLLEKKIEKGPLILNGVLGKELRLGDKSLDLVENHIEKALSRDIIDTNDNQIVDDKIKNKKRPANDDIVESEPKKLLLSSSTTTATTTTMSSTMTTTTTTTTTNVNGSTNIDSPAPDSVSSSNGDDGVVATVSTAAAKLFADIAADILEDEDEEQLLQEAQSSTTTTTTTQTQQQSNEQNPTIITQQLTTTPQTTTNTVQQLLVDNNQQVLLTQPRQIIVSQSQLHQQATNQVVISHGTQIKTQTGQTVIVQNSNQQRTPMVLQQSNTGQILLSQSLQGQMQLVASTTQPGQYLLQTTNNTQGTYMVAQPQTAVVHGQPQTVLVAQTTSQQQGGAKTIIILQQQPTTTNQATHHQKVMVTPQGQQVVVTQVPRPILHTSSVTNNIIPATSVIKTTPVSVLTQTTTTTNGINLIEKRLEECKPKICRDLTTPFVCEWGDCNIDTKFKSANQVYLHACEAHCPKGSDEIICQWERCDNMKRKRFSLMTHLSEKHCNTEIMKQSLIKRKQSSHGGKVEPTPTTTTTPHPGYAPDAALHAIKRHALEFVNPKELQQKPTPKQGTPSVTVTPPRPGPPSTDQDDNEGPVTKSIRLTASLILRNLVIYSSNCRRYLKHYEPHLANVALSNVESSRTIAQVLYDMNEGSTHR